MGELDGIKSKNNGDGSTQIQCMDENNTVHYESIADDSFVFPKNITMNWIEKHLNILLRSKRSFCNSTGSYIQKLFQRYKDKKELYIKTCFCSLHITHMSTVTLIPGRQTWGNNMIWSYWNRQKTLRPTFQTNASSPRCWTGIATHQKDANVRSAVTWFNKKLKRKIRLHNCSRWLHKENIH